MLSMLALSLRNAYDTLIGSEHPTLGAIIKSVLESLEPSYRLSVWLLNSGILEYTAVPHEFVLVDDPLQAQAQLRELEKKANELEGVFHAKFSQELQHLSDVYEKIIEEIYREEALFEDGEDYGEANDIAEDRFGETPSADTFEFSDEIDYFDEQQGNHYWVQLSKAYLGLPPTHPVTNNEIYRGESKLLRQTLIYKILSNKNNPLRRIAQVAFSELLAKRSQRSSLNQVCERVLLVANQSHPNPKHAEINLTKPESLRGSFLPLTEIRDLPLELTLKGELHDENIASIVTYLRRLLPQFKHIKLRSLHIKLDTSQASSLTLQRFLDCLTEIFIFQLDLSFYSQIPNSPDLIRALRDAVSTLKPQELVLQPSLLLSPTHFEMTKLFVTDNPKLRISISKELQAEREACPNAAKRPRFDFSLQHQLLNFRRAHILELQAVCSKVFDVFDVGKSSYNASDSQYLIKYISRKIQPWLKNSQAEAIDTRLREWRNREEILVKQLNAESRRCDKLNRGLFPSVVTEGFAFFIADQFIRWFDGYIRPEITGYLHSLFIGMSNSDSQLELLIEYFLSPVRIEADRLPEIPRALEDLLCTNEDRELATVCDAFRSIIAQREDDDEAPIKIDMLDYFLTEDSEFGANIISLTSEGTVCLDELERLRILILFFKRIHESFTLFISDQQVIERLRNQETAAELLSILAQTNDCAVSFPLRSDTLHLLSLF